jgi:uncharacterized protein
MNKIKYRSSKYNLVWKKGGNSYLIFNTLTGALKEINKEEYKIIKEIFRKPANYSLNSPKKKEIYNLLIEGGFLISETINELDSLKMRHRREKFRRDILSLGIMPNLACNFKCIYCFEVSHPNKRMSKNVQNGIINFVKNKIKEGCKVLYVTWYGGEPLLELPLILKLSRKLKKICEENNCDYNAFLTTNGYLLNNKTLQLLKNSNIKGIQITIDGPPDIHNKHRPLKNGGETFNTIFNNFMNLLTSNIVKKLECIKLRINFDEESFNRVGEILDFIPQKLRSKITVYFSRVFRNVTWTDVKPCIQDTSFKLATKLSQIAIRKGYTLSRLPRSGKSLYCLSNLFNFFLIDPEGKFHKCDVGMETLPPVGYIVKNGKYLINSVEMAKWMKLEPFEDTNCLKCKALPFCMGGCPLLRLLKLKKETCPFKNAHWLKNDIELFYLSSTRKNKKYSKDKSFNYSLS